MTKLRMKFPYCGCWNRLEVDKIFVPQPSPEPNVKVLIPMYKPLKTERCEKCGKVIAEPKELIRISARPSLLVYGYPEPDETGVQFDNEGCEIDA